jgi:hypothetical protein
MIRIVDVTREDIKTIKRGLRAWQNSVVDGLLEVCKTADDVRRKLEAELRRRERAAARKPRTAKKARKPR